MKERLKSFSFVYIILMMKQEYRTFYEKITEPIRRKGWEHLIINTDRILSYVFYISYPLFILFLFVTKNEMLMKSIWIPACSFLLVSIMRKIYNRPRPYETEGIDPIIKRDKRGESLPSRHVFSAMIISVTFFMYDFKVGMIYLSGALLSAFCRVTGGVHYPSDVIVSIILAVIAAFLYL